MDQFSKQDLKDLMAPRQGHCISLYLPTHRAPVEGRQDLIRFKNMLRDVEEKIVAAGVRGPEAKAFMVPLHRLLDDQTFWQYRGDGLALFYSRDGLRAYRLPVHFGELNMLSNRFHLKPLIPLLTEESAFYVLALSQNDIRLLEGNRYCAWEVELEHVPSSLAEAIPYDEPERQFQFRGKTPTGPGGRRYARFFAHGVGIDGNKDEICRFFQIVDKGLQEVLRRDHIPLILAGVEYLFAVYRGVNSYAHLMGEGIPGSPETLSVEELHQQAWKIVQPRLLHQRNDVIAQYRQFAGTGRTSRDLVELVPAAFGGRILKLVASEGIQVWGSYQPGDGMAKIHAKPTAESEDLLDLAAIHTVLSGGMVYTAEPAALPDNAPAVALFRY
ncbi:MAG: hypothetical protein LLG97_16675 [Deltaproteobacteria bacterium]|nr:hypothetical protein [Deltaproteobacteria bacterium]